MSSSSRLSRLRQQNGGISKQTSQNVKTEVTESPSKLTLKQIAIMHEHRIQQLEQMNKNLLEELESMKETLRSVNATTIPTSQDNEDKDMD